MLQYPRWRLGFLLAAVVLGSGCTGRDTDASKQIKPGMSEAQAEAILGQLPRITHGKRTVSDVIGDRTGKRVRPGSMASSRVIYLDDANRQTITVQYEKGVVVDVQVLPVGGVPAAAPPDGSTEAGKATAMERPVVVMKTSLGTITIELYPDKAPGTVKNFLGYVDEKFYDGTVFHRVIPDFMIQGGGFEKGFSRAIGIEEAKAKEKKTRAPIPNESSNGMSNKTYTIAMARTNDPHSAAAQFFINTRDNDRLDRAHASDGAGYCVFGKVVAGTDVVERIKNVRTRVLVSRAFEDVPIDEVVIESVRRVEK